MSKVAKRRDTITHKSDALPKSGPRTIPSAKLAEPPRAAADPAKATRAGIVANNPRAVEAMLQALAGFDCLGPFLEGAMMGLAEDLEAMARFDGEAGARDARGPSLLRLSERARAILAVNEALTASGHA